MSNAIRFQLPGPLLRHRRQRDYCVARRNRWVILVTALAAALSGFALNRDMEFVCPCQVEADGETASLTFGLRNFRASDSRPLEVQLTISTDAESWASMVALDSVTGESAVAAATYSVDIEGTGGGPFEVSISLYEIEDDHRQFQDVVYLMPSIDEPTVDSLAFQLSDVDLLADSDDDGVGDVNEGLAGTDPGDADSTPGKSTIDVVAFYDQDFGDRLADPRTWIHHQMTTTNVIYADNGTNARLRTVGTSEFDAELPRREWIEATRELFELHGADLGIYFTGPGDFIAGSAPLLGSYGRGIVERSDVAYANIYGLRRVRVLAHEFGHMLGLAHSYRQGETDGAYRWSRGHFLDDRFGTLMAYARGLEDRFSNPDAANCLGRPCGVALSARDAADAVKTIDIVRIQVAAFRAPKPDSDEDGFVDPADAFPEDPQEWRDTDEDGTGDAADPDDDNDGVPDSDDPFPRDPEEWADADKDGIGDNADDDVRALALIPDANLRAIIVEVLDKPRGTELTVQDLLELTMIDAEGKNIRDLAGLESATNLEELRIPDNQVRDISPIVGLPELRIIGMASNEVVDVPSLDLLKLEELDLRRNRVFDLSGFVNLPNLRELNLDVNLLTDIEPLADMTSLTHLSLNSNAIEQIFALSGLTGLVELRLRLNQFISDISVLSALTELEVLDIAFNRVSDLGPMAGLVNLVDLSVGGNDIGHLVPIEGLNGIRHLRVGQNPVSVNEVLALPYAANLRTVGLAGLGIADFSWLTEFADANEILLGRNEIVDLAPLLEHAPLGEVDVIGNPLNLASVRAHIPSLEDQGVVVHYGVVIDFPDEALRDALAMQIFGVRDRAITDGDVRYLPELRAARMGIRSLAGLDVIATLSHLNLSWNEISDVSPLGRFDWIGSLYLRGNNITDVSPLGGLYFSQLDLSHNRISDLEPLSGARSLDVSSNEISDLTPLTLWSVADLRLADNQIHDLSPLLTLYIDRVDVSGNPLSEESLNEHIPALRENGTEVEVGVVEHTLATGGDVGSFDTAGYFESLLGGSVVVTVVVGDPSLVTVEVADGVINVEPGMGAGTVEVTATGTNDAGETATITFEVAVARAQRVGMFPHSGHLARQGFVRVINHSAEAGTIRIDAVDDSGYRAEPVTMAIGAGATAHFNSDDLEDGNYGKRLSGGVGRGQGDWRLGLASSLDIEVLSYIRTTDGFLTAMHDFAPELEGEHRVAVFNPASNVDQVSQLRLMNPGQQDVSVTIRGVDDRGDAADADIEVVVRAFGATTRTAEDLEEGNDVVGALGDGTGKWRLAVTADQAIHVMSLLGSPGGYLTNLSTVANATGDHAVPLIPAASDPAGRQGFVRVVNRAATSALVTIAAFDDTGAEYEPLTLSVAGRETVHFNSDDLEMGNPGKGLSGSTGAGEGDWRLALTSEADIDVLSYVRTTDGFLTTMHETVPSSGNRHRVVVFNPGRNTNQVSRLRLINTGSQTAEVTIVGTDDMGWPSGEVRTSVPAHGARSYTAAQLEIGAEDLDGSLGTGTGKWQLLVESDQAVTVMSLLENPTGHLTNLSAARAR